MVAVSDSAFVLIRVPSCTPVSLPCRCLWQRLFVFCRESAVSGSEQSQEWKHCRETQWKRGETTEYTVCNTAVTWGDLKLTLPIKRPNILILSVRQTCFRVGSLFWVYKTNNPQPHKSKFSFIWFMIPATIHSEGRACLELFQQERTVHILYHRLSFSLTLDCSLNTNKCGWSRIWRWLIQGNIAGAAPTSPTFLSCEPIMGHVGLCL